MNRKGRRVEYNEGRKEEQKQERGDAWASPSAKGEGYQGFVSSLKELYLL
ncbi:MAG: hypothetical protein U0694_17580 [Anaerolineae bacterium]